MTRLDLPSPECIDGETLAAWSSGSLRATEAAAVEAHLSNCERCQSMLATFVRIEPQPAPAESVWRRWHLPWVVPIATAATVAAIWVAIPSDRPESLTETAPVADMFEPRQPEASQRKSQASLPPSKPLRSDDKAAAPANAAEAQAQKRNRKLQPQAAAREGAASSARADLRAEREAGERKREADARSISPPPPPPPAALAAPAVVEERAAAKAAPSAPQPPPAALQETVALRSLNRSADTLLAKQIASPDATHQWRISGGRQIDRSSTGGKQWEAVAVLESDRLTAGHSPSPTVVWAVGPTGTIYVTSDGKRFEKVPFIEAVDLVSVVAIDDRQASVTAADGRIFRTMDRGVTWTRVQ